MKKQRNTGSWCPPLPKFDLKMKLTALLVLTALFGLQANNSYSQKTKISLDVKNMSVASVIDEIESTTDYRFVYITKYVDIDRKVSLKVRRERIKKVLGILFDMTDTDYTVEDTQILLTYKDKSEEITTEKKETTILGAQQAEISGKVTDKDGVPLPGASIVEKGTSNGTQTDFDGNFSLELVGEDPVLVISYIGFAAKEVQVNGQNTINVTLLADTANLDEVVVIGYGTVKKSDLTGAVASVSQKEIQDVPVASIDQSIQGRAAGVTVTQTSGAPGAGISIRIRGGNSISGGNEPLYVIDGIPVYSNNNLFQPGDGSFNVGEGQNALATLNPGDIESIEILKDASATAIYGSRGSNGVVIITTKKGEAGKPKFSFNTYTGFQEVSRTLDLLVGSEHLAFKNEQLVNLGIPVRYGVPDGRFPMPLDEYGATDWQDEIFRTAVITNHQLSVSGGSENSKYFISGSYFDQEGTIINSGFKRYSLRINMDNKLSDRMTLTNSLSLSRSQNNPTIDAGGEGVLTNALRFTPALPVFDEDGNYSINVGPGSGLSQMVNPVQLARETINEIETDRVLANFALDYELVNNLKLRVSVGGDIVSSQRRLFFPNNFEYATLAVNENGSAVSSFTRSTNLLNENTLSYKYEINPDNVFDFLAGITFQSQEIEISTAQTNDFVTNVNGPDNLSVGASPQPTITQREKWGLNSYLARVNYNHKNKYLLTLSGRLDGSSRFGENNKYGFFPSAAFAWRVSEESFFGESETFSSLKFRASYGITGNQEIGLYQSLARLGTLRTVFDNGANTPIGVFPQNVANPDLRWEKTAQFNVGLDMSFFKNRVQLSADYYNKKTEDLLVAIELPATSGASSALSNIGSLRNEGLEFTLNTRILDGEFSWQASGNLAWNRNEVLDIGVNDDIILSADGIGSSNIITRGESVASFYGLVWDGVWQDQAEIDASGIAPNANPGDWKFKDVNGDGVFNEADDRTIIGDGLPDLVYGFTNDFSWKGLDLSIFFQGVSGNEILNLNRRSLEDGQPNFNMLTTVRNRWTVDNPSNTNVRMAARHPNTASTFLIEDGSFLRLRNVTLGYNIPMKSERLKSFISSARIYVTGQNLWTITDYRGFDPEVNSEGQDNVLSGIDYGTYPKAVSYILGIDVSF
ncbi:TonB-dependent receptor [Allomuricauda sp. SCSIO 65647]|uniref:TonB-dependent receptor n=1 Tax=Allomuricauda sp. SCSIO 65647 TaxID=2908843 RepID=UPI001F43E12F|nr:TonB-dependent receptor [Muricauda sp. SCSIO 65647]UJH67053.1 TonB-dependent receptor [Muricauda sp. SCSIO 65647]